MRTLLPAIALAFAAASCSSYEPYEVPVDPKPTSMQLKDPDYIEANCYVAPVGFKQELVVKTPSIPLESAGHFITGAVFGHCDDGVTTMMVVIERNGPGWHWLNSPPNLTLPGDIQVPAQQLVSEVVYGQRTKESYGWPFTRDELGVFAGDGFVGDLPGPLRIKIERGVFKGFLARWDKEFASTYGGK